MLYAFQIKLYFISRWINVLLLLFIVVVVVVANVVGFVAFIVIGLLYGLVNRDLWLECVLVDGFSVTVLRILLTEY